MTMRIAQINDNQANTAQWDERALPRRLTQSIALAESPMPNLLLNGVALIGVMLAAFLIWSSITPIEEIAVASGQVVPSGYVQSVQHLEGGIVKQILVLDGQLVEKGQVLMRLDDTAAGADLGQMLARQKALKLQTSRLKKFSGATDASELTENEQQILTSMNEARDSQRGVLRDQISQKEKELQGLAATKSTINRNVALMQKENEIRQGLAEKGYGSRLMALTSERELNQMRGQLAETKNQENRARDAIREAQGRLQSLNADLKQQAMKSLGDVDAELSEVNQSLEKLQNTASRTEITAPVRGLIKGLAVHTVGAVAEQGKVLMEIVPVDEEMIVEAMVQPSDIGHITQGQAVKIKVSSYDYSRYGSTRGHLESVSATSFQTQDSQSFYKARIRLDKSFVGADPKRNAILPGMTVEADIVTGEKTVMRYLLKPIQVAMSGGFHER